MSRWTNGGVFAALAVIQFVTSRPSLVSRLVIPAALLGLAVWLSPLLKSKVNAISHAEAVRLLDEAAPGDEPVVIYHRPGCSFCARLKATLTGVRSRAYWVDVWDDPAGSDYIKSVNGGFETVPTVMLGGTPQTNPEPSVVRAALAAA